MANKLNWTPGSQGKGNVYPDYSVETWNIDAAGNPHHNEVAQQRPKFLFYIMPDGGVTDGGIGHQNSSSLADTDMIRAICEADPRLHDGSHVNDHNLPATPRVEDGFGHAYNLLQAKWVTATNELDDVEQPHQDVQAELRSWLDSFSAPSTEPITLHHDTVADLFPTTPETAAQTPHVDPSDHPYEPYDWSKDSSWAKVATHWVYHVSPRANRDAILSEGLRGHEREHAQSPHEYTWPQPPGNYFFANPDDAHNYAWHLEAKARGGDFYGDHFSWEDRYETPEMPQDWAQRYPDPDEALEAWQDHVAENDLYHENTDDPHGYDVYKVDATGLPMAPDPEPQITNPRVERDQSDLGEIYDAQVADNGDIWDDGAAPVRMYTGAPVEPTRIQHYEHVPAWDMTEHDYQGIMAAGIDSEVPNILHQLPYTEVPQPVHDQPWRGSKTAGLNHDKNGWGRGVVYNGEIHTWPEDWGTHGAFIHSVLQADPRQCDKFVFDPWGQLTGPSDPAHRALVEQALQGQPQHTGALDAHLARLYGEEPEYPS